MKMYIRKCKDCGKNVEVEKRKTVFRCEECKEVLTSQRLKKRSINICTNCGDEFEKDPHSRAYHCQKCKDIVIKCKTHSTCSRCKQYLNRKNFPLGNTTICFDCLEKVKREKEERYKNKIYTRNCKRCGCDVKTHDRYATVINCEACEEKKQDVKKNKTFIRKCLGCDNKVETKGHATLVYCKECKEKNVKKKKKKQLDYINRKHYRTCQYCNNVEEVQRNVKHRHYTCTNCLIKPKYLRDYIRSCKICEKEMKVKNPYITFLICEDCKNKKDEYKIYSKNNLLYRKCSKCKQEFETKAKSRRYICYSCKPKKIKKNMIYITFAKKKHFGYYGIASDGHKWWSLNEQDVEEWLIARNIKHEPHPRLGKTLKHADQYLPEFDLYIEIDGLSRKTDVDWCGKLSLYNTLGLKYKIIKPGTHFIDSEYRCFQELDNIFSEMIIG